MKSLFFLSCFALGRFLPNAAYNYPNTEKFSREVFGKVQDVVDQIQSHELESLISSNTQLKRSIDEAVKLIGETAAKTGFNTIGYGSTSSFEFSIFVVSIQSRLQEIKVLLEAKDFVGQQMQKLCKELKATLSELKTELKLIKEENENELKRVGRWAAVIAALTGTAFALDLHLHQPQENRVA